MFLLAANRRDRNVQKELVIRGFGVWAGGWEAGHLRASEQLRWAPAALLPSALRLDPILEGLQGRGWRSAPLGSQHLALGSGGDGECVCARRTGTGYRASGDGPELAGLCPGDRDWTASVPMHQQPLCSEGSSYSYGLLPGFGGLLSSKRLILSLLLSI